MNLEKRISNLEQIQQIDNGQMLQGIMFFHKKNVVVDGVSYESIDSIPKEVLERHSGQFKQLKT